MRKASSSRAGMSGSAGRGNAQPSHVVTVAWVSARSPSRGGGWGRGSSTGSEASPNVALSTSKPSRAVTGPTSAAAARAGMKRVRSIRRRSEEHTSELQSRENLVCRLLLEKKKREEQGNDRSRKSSSYLVS